MADFSGSNMVFTFNAIPAAASELANYKERNEAQKNTILAYQEENAGLKAKIAKLKDDVLGLSQHNSILENQRHGMYDKAIKQAQEVVELRSVLEDANAYISKLERENDALVAEFDKVEEKNRMLRDNIAAQAGVIDDTFRAWAKDEEGLRNRIEALEEELKIRSGRLQEKNKRITELENIFAATNENFTKIDGFHRSMKPYIEEIKQRVELLIAEKAALVEKAVKLENDVKWLGVSNAHYRRLYNESQAAREAFVKEVRGDNGAQTCYNSGD